MKENSKEPAMWLIIVLFIFCWPLAIFLLYIEYVRGFIIEKDNKISILQRKQKNNQTLAILFLIVTLVFVSVTLPDTSEDWSTRIGDSILFVALFGIPSYIFFKNAKKAKDIIEKSIRYNDLIVIRNITSIDELSLKLQTSRENVLRVVTQMIREKQLDAYIKNDSEIVIRKNSYYINPKVTSVKCTNCGAENRFVSGEENICEYCGSILNY